MSFVASSFVSSAPAIVVVGAFAVKNLLNAFSMVVMVFQVVVLSTNVKLKQIQASIPCGSKSSQYYRWISLREWIFPR